MGHTIAYILLHVGCAKLTHEVANFILLQRRLMIVRQEWTSHDKPNSENIHTSPMVQVLKFVIHHNDSLSSVSGWGQDQTTRPLGFVLRPFPIMDQPRPTKLRTYSVFVTAEDVAACWIRHWWHDGTLCSTKGLSRTGPPSHWHPSDHYWLWPGQEEEWSLLVG